MVPQAVIERCERGEERAQYEMYRLLHPLMISICRRYTRDRQLAVSRLNAAFLKVLTQLDKRRPEVPFTLWVRRITINTIIDDLRHAKAITTLEYDAPLDEVQVPAELNGYLEHMEADALQAMLLRVPEMSRHVFNLFALDGHAHAEIAAMLGISEGTSKWHVAHARSILRDAIATHQAAHTPKSLAR